MQRGCFENCKKIDQVKEDEMGMACSMNVGRRGMHIGY
jgi:hypothetical protein